MLIMLNFKNHMWDVFYIYGLECVCVSENVVQRWAARPDQVLHLTYLIKLCPDYFPPSNFNCSFFLTGTISLLSLPPKLTEARDGQNLLLV